MPVDHVGRKFSDAEPAASTRWVLRLLWSGPAICWLFLRTAGFEARPISSAGKIERPTAVRTVFERPEG